MEYSKLSVQLFSSPWRIHIKYLKQLPKQPVRNKRPNGRIKMHVKSIVECKINKLLIEQKINIQGLDP